MSLQQNVEAAIKEAMERGEFENLHGRGKPIDQNTYFETPAELRAALTLLKNAGVLPEEVELLKGLASLKESFAAAETAAESLEIGRLWNEKQLRYDLLMERRCR